MRRATGPWNGDGRIECPKLWLVAALVMVAASACAESEPSQASARGSSESGMRTSQGIADQAGRPGMRSVPGLSEAAQRCRATASQLMTTVTDEAWSRHFIEAPVLHAFESRTSDATKLQLAAQTWLARSPVSETDFVFTLACLSREVQRRRARTRFEARLDISTVAPIDAVEEGTKSSMDVSGALFKLLKWNRTRLIASASWPEIAESTLTLGEIASLAPGFASLGNLFFSIRAYGLRVDVCWALGAKTAVDSGLLLALAHKIDSVDTDGEFETEVRELRQLAASIYVQRLLFLGWSGEVPASSAFWADWRSVVADVDRLSSVEQAVGMGLPEMLSTTVEVVSEFHRCRTLSQSPEASHACGSARRMWSLRGAVVATVGLAANLAVARAALIVEAFRQRHSRLPLTLQEAYSDLGLRPDRDPFDGGIVRYEATERGFSCKTTGWTPAQVSAMDGYHPSEAGRDQEGERPVWLHTGGSDVVCNVEYAIPNSR